MKSKSRDSYLITNQTQMIMAQIKNGRIESIVYDHEGIHKLPVSSSKLIRSTARFHGASMQSMTKFSRQFFGDALHKLPICLTTSYNGPCVFFPLWSPRTTTNIWINANAVTHICQDDDGTLLTLRNGKEVKIPFQYLSFCSLYSRAIIFSKYLSTQKHI